MKLSRHLLRFSYFTTYGKYRICTIIDFGFVTGSEGMTFRVSLT